MSDTLINLETDIKTNFPPRSSRCKSTCNVITCYYRVKFKVYWNTGFTKEVAFQKISF